MVEPFPAYIDRAFTDYKTHLETRPTKEAAFALGLKLEGAKEFALFLAGTPPPEPFAGRKKRTAK